MQSDELGMMISATELYIVILRLVIVTFIKDHTVAHKRKLQLSQNLSPGVDGNASGHAAETCISVEYLTLILYCLIRRLLGAENRTQG